MGSKIMWGGLTIILTTTLLNIPAQAIVGSVLMVIGCILYIFDK